MFKAVYLVAGVGQRLRPFTDTTHKALLEIGGRPMLAWSVDALVAGGVRDLVVVTGYREDQIRRFFSHHYRALNVRFIRNDLYESTNNSYSLWHAHDGFSGEGMILLDGDLVFDRALMERMLATEPDRNYLAVRRSPELGTEEMKVMVDGGRISAIAKTLDPRSCYGESIGIEKFSADFTQKLFAVLDRRMNGEDRRGEYYEASFQELIDGGETVEMVDTGPHRCIEIDTAEDLEEARRVVWPGDRA